jgi:hypothetical protein
MRFFKIILLFLLLVSFQMTAFAEIFIVQSGSTQEQALVYNAKPGETIADKIEVKNLGGVDQTVEIAANNLLVNTDGSVTIGQNSENKTGLNSWLTFAGGKYATATNSTTELPFGITIPADAKAGEYGAGFSVLVKQSGEGEVKNVTRKGIKIYLNVAPESSYLAGQIVNGKILNPAGEMLKTYQDKLGYWNKNNLVIAYNAVNEGNIFGILRTNWRVTFADGSVKEGKTSLEIVPNSGDHEYLIATGTGYKEGQTKLEIEYAIEPLNKQNESLKKGNTSGKIQNNFNLKRENLNTFRGVNTPENSVEISQTNDIGSTLAKVAGILVFLVGAYIYVNHIHPKITKKITKK